MSYRFMRLLVFFDLPTETPTQRSDYRKFRRVLIKNGFVMLQESVYCRMLLNGSVQKSVLDIITKNKPPSGIVQLLTVTEKQFAGMTYITGTYKSDVVDSDERLIIL